MSGERATVCVYGASGYVGGELLRLLLQHPMVDVSQAISRSSAGAFLHRAHPNLRGQTTLRFEPPEAARACDALFLCAPHGESSKRIKSHVEMAGRVIDLAADFRLRSAAAYEAWYGERHPAPDWLERFVYGLPETQREALQGARFASGVGCNATAVNLALAPLARAGLIASAVADLKVGSSEAGAVASDASHHPERAGAVRSFAPVGHRHQAEVAQELGAFELHMSVTSVEMVRGVVCTAHVFPTRALDMKSLWALYREAYAGEPFVRLVADRAGLHRYPDAKILAGSNCCDVGFAVDERTGRVVVISALDNLMKGAAGSAVQCMNLMCGWDEAAGLTFPGLHPI